MLDATAFSVKLDRLARLAVEVGVNLQDGQELIVNAPIEAAPLVRLIAKHAYRAGASEVLLNYSDQQLSLIRLQDGVEASFDHVPAWRYEGLLKGLEAGAAMLSIAGNAPDLLASCDPVRKARVQKATATASRPIAARIGGFKNSWSILAYATPDWAASMFPELPVEAAVAKLWEAIFATTRTDQDDPTGLWRAHIATLHSRAAWLTAQGFAALHFTGPGTDLRVGLVPGHLWRGGAVDTQAGITCLPNMPTEEVFTMPHRDRVDGVVRATKPLSHNGTLMEDIAVRFEAGRAVEATARTGEAALRHLIATDEGAARLGEVALVPHASPVSESGLLFLNTLFDENAASHIAFGRALGINSTKPTLEETEGANLSLIHVDWMIGSDQIDVDGVGADGGKVPVMRAGAFVI